jgi:hypothetical protein
VIRLMRSRTPPSSPDSEPHAKRMEFPIGTGICVMCFAHTRSTTTAPERISRWGRIRRYQDPSRRSEAFCRCRSSADYTISMFGSDFRQAHRPNLLSLS